LSRQVWGLQRTGDPVRKLGKIQRACCCLGHVSQAEFQSPDFSLQRLTAFDQFGQGEGVGLIGIHQPLGLPAQGCESLLLHLDFGVGGSGSLPRQLDTLRIAQQVGEGIPHCWLDGLGLYHTRMRGDMGGTPAAAVGTKVGHPAVLGAALQSVSAHTANQ